mgnify:FL=1
MLRKLVILSVVLLFLFPVVTNSQFRIPTPGNLKGVPLSSVKGWFAGIYPWPYVPEYSTVHPVMSLWDSPLWDPVE